MRHFRLASAIAAGTMAAGALSAALTMTAPTASAHTLGDDQRFCTVIDGTFTTEVFGGQTHSTCTFTVGDDTHHFYYSDGEFTGAD